MAKRTVSKIQWLAVLLLFLIAPVARFFEGRDWMPNDAVAYVGWVGFVVVMLVWGFRIHRQPQA
jgi:hypothetical protein